MLELTQKDQAWVKETMEKIVEKMSWVSEKSQDKIPYTTINGVHSDESGKEAATSRGASWWTNGFWGGMLWQMYKETGDEKYANIAKKIRDCTGFLYGRIL